MLCLCLGSYCKYSLLNWFFFKLLRYVHYFSLTFMKGGGVFDRQRGFYSALLVDNLTREKLLSLDVNVHFR